MLRDQIQFFSHTKNLRTTTEKIVFHTISPKSAALLLKYDKYKTK
jgi:hypothetical protein